MYTPSGTVYIVHVRIHVMIWAGLRLHKLLISFEPTAAISSWFSESLVLVDRTLFATLLAESDGVGVGTNCRAGSLGRI